MIFLYAGRRLLRHVNVPSPDPDSRIGRLTTKHGARGLGLIGPVFPGVAGAVLLGLALDVNRRSLAIWMSIGIAGMFALYVAGMVLLIDVVGLE